MKYIILSVISFLLFIDEPAAQHSYPVYGQTPFSAKLSDRSDNSPVDTAYLDIRIDSHGQQFLTLDNYTDTTIMYLSGHGQINYEIEALNPALNEWQPLGDYDPSKFSCGVGVYNYEIVPNTYTWTRLSNNRYPGNLSTQIRYVLNANGQTFRSAIQLASIDPLYFGTLAVDSGSSSHLHMSENSFAPDGNLPIIKYNLSILLKNGFGRYSVIYLKDSFEKIENPSIKYFTLAFYIVSLQSALSQAEIEDVELNSLLAGVLLYFDQVDAIGEQYQREANNLIQSRTSILNSDPNIQAIIANYEDRLDFFFPEVVGPIIEKYFEY